MSHQKKTPCSSCPWLKTSDQDTCFKPEALERTVGVYLADGRVHPCHGSHDQFCVGYLSYAKYKKEGGLDGMTIATLGIRLGLIDPDKIENLDTYDTVTELLADHGRRSDNIDVMDNIFGRIGGKSKPKRNKRNGGKYQ